MPARQVFDPLRKKNVALTPEEEVRQWFITVLRDIVGVPLPLMMSEVNMKTGELVSVIGGPGRKSYRADILVYDRSLKPLLVVECKRPGVELDAAVVNQTLRYCGILGVRYMAVTNGRKTFFAAGGDGGLRLLHDIPAYEEMIEK